MVTALTSEPTSFTLDNMGRFLCNTLQEALDSTSLTFGGRERKFDAIVIGGGTFGAVVAEQLFLHDATHSRRILVLEAGPFVLPEHVQNLPFQGGAPDLRVPWVNHPALNYSGLIFAIGGRSLTWGGWSPELLDEEMAAWPMTTRNALRSQYFAEASRHIGVKETNDFIYGPLHTALRKQLHAGLKSAVNATGFAFTDLLDHPTVRYPDPGDPTPIPDALLRQWLGLPVSDTTPRGDLLDMFKLEAPLAVQSTTLPGFFPTNKFSAVPGLIRAARLATTEADIPNANADASMRQEADARKRLMIVPNCHVQDLVTETQADNWVRVTGVRVWQNGSSVVIPLAAPFNGGQSTAIIALGTIESTRLALTTFQQSLAGRAAQRMGTNLVAHLRSNLNIRVPRAAIAANLPPTVIPSLQCSALLVKGKASNEHTFHFQITASGLQKLGVNSEAELFQKVPTLEHLQDMLRSSDDTVVITIRGIGDMSAHNPDSFIELSTLETDIDRPKAVVHLGNAKAPPQQFPGSAQTQNDRTTWDEMDSIADKIALIFAGDEPFDILAGNRTLPVAVGTHAQRLAVLAAFKDRRDDLGTTHHDAGTLRMGDDVADSVTNEFGRIHDTTNCYVAGPALFPTLGSPNPMLTGVALGRRTAIMLGDAVLPKADPVPPLEAGFRALFDGTAKAFRNWQLAGPAGGGMAHVNGEMVSYGGNGLRLFFYAAELFGDFTLRMQFRIFDATRHNSGVFVRFPRPSLDLSPALALRSTGEPSFDIKNPAWKPVISGFEVQIDDNARGDSGKDFWGIKPEPDGLFKNRTGAIYKIPAGDRIWHLGFNEPATQTYMPGPALQPDVWFEYEIIVQGDDFKVFLTNLQSGQSAQTTHFINTDAARGGTPGCIGIQAYPGNTVAWRNIRIKTM
ncbi:MAG: family 16 glycoside hydrolase [Leptothrix sp. (in: b-proteobacteria)]